MAKQKSTIIEEEPIIAPEEGSAREQQRAANAARINWIESGSNNLAYRDETPVALQGEWSDLGNSKHDIWNVSNPREGELNEIRAADQGFWEKIGLGATKMTTTAATTFLDNTVGFLWGVVSAVGHGDASKIYDNDFTNAMSDFNEWCEEQMPHYSSKYEGWGADFWGNFIGKDILQNAGFQIGTGLSMIVPGAALKAPGQAFKATKMFSNFMKTGRAINTGNAAKDLVISTYAAVGESSIEALNNKRDFVKYQKQVADDEFNARNAELDMQWKQLVATKYGGDENAARNSMDFNEYWNKQNELKRMRSDKEKFIQKEAEKVGDMTFLANLALVGGTNFSTFGKAFTGYNLNKRFGDITQDIVDAEGKVIKKNVWNSTAKDVIKSGKYKVKNENYGKWVRNSETGKLEKDTRKYLEKTAKVEARAKEKSTGWNIAKDMFLEGLEEMNQETAAQYSAGIAETEMLQYEALANSGMAYDDILKQMNDTWFSYGEMAKALGKVYTDPAQYRQFFGGALGMVFSPHFTKKPGGGLQFHLNNIGAQSAAIRKQNSTNAYIAEQINKTLNSDESKNYLTGLLRHSALERVKQGAVAEDRRMDYEDADFAQFVSDITMMGNAGKLDLLQARLENMRNMSDEEMEKVCMQLASTKDKNGKSEVIGDFVDKNGNYLGNTEADKLKIRKKINARIDRLQKDISLYQNTMNDIDGRTGGKLDHETLASFTWAKAQLMNRYSRAKEIIGGEASVKSLGVFKDKLGSHLTTLTNNLTKNENDLKVEKERLSKLPKIEGKPVEASEMQKNLEASIKTLTQEINIAKELSQLCNDMEALQVYNDDHNDDKTAVTKLFEKYADFAESMPNVAKAMGLIDENGKKATKKGKDGKEVELIPSLEDMLYSGKFNDLMRLNSKEDVEVSDDEKKLMKDYRDAAMLNYRARQMEISLDRIIENPNQYTEHRADLQQRILEHANKKTIKAIEKEIQKGIDEGSITLDNLEEESKRITDNIKAITNERGRVRQLFDRAVEAMQDTPYDELRQIAIRNITKKNKNLGDMRDLINYVYMNITANPKLSDAEKQVAMETFNKFVKGKKSIADIYKAKVKPKNVDVNSLYVLDTPENQEAKRALIGKDPKITLENYRYTEQSYTAAQIAKNEIPQIINDAVERIYKAKNQPELADQLTTLGIDENKVAAGSESAKTRAEIDNKAKSIEQGINKLLETFKDGEILNNEEKNELFNKVQDLIDKTFNSDDYADEYKAEIDNLNLRWKAQSLDMIQSNLESRVASKYNDTDIEGRVEIEKAFEEINKEVSKIQRSLEQSKGNAAFNDVFDRIAKEDYSVNVKNSFEIYYNSNGTIYRGHAVPCESLLNGRKCYAVTQQLDVDSFQYDIIDENGAIIGTLFRNELVEPSKRGESIKLDFTELTSFDVNAPNLQSFREIATLKVPNITSEKTKRDVTERCKACRESFQEDGILDENGETKLQSNILSTIAKANMIMNAELTESKAEIEDVVETPTEIKKEHTGIKYFLLQDENGDMIRVMFPSNGNRVTFKDENGKTTTKKYSKALFKKEGYEGVIRETYGNDVEIIESSLNEWKGEQAKPTPVQNDTKSEVEKGKSNKTKEQLSTKNDIQLVFERNPELANIGTENEYAEYVNEIFPNSVEKDIYWHGTNEDFSDGFNTAKRGEGSGALETKKRNDLYLNKQGWASLQYVNGVNRTGSDKNRFAHWNKLWWELKEIMSNGRRENNDWKDIVINDKDVNSIRQAIPNKKGKFDRDKGGEHGKWLKERKADYGYENKSDKEFFEEVFGLQLGKDTFNTWTARNAEVFKAMETTAKGIYPVVINVTNPIVEEGQNTYYEEQRGLFSQADRNGNDAILSRSADNEFNSDVAIVINANSNNVHWLGSKTDIEQFRQWKAKKSHTTIPTATQQRKATQAKAEAQRKRSISQLDEQIAKLDNMLVRLQDAAKQNPQYHDTVRTVQTFKQYVEFVRNNYKALGEPKNVVLDENQVFSMMDSFRQQLGKIFGNDVQFLSDEEIRKKITDLSNKQLDISFNKENTIENETQRNTEERYSGGRANDAITAIIRESESTSSRTLGLEETATGESSQDDRNYKQEGLIEKWSKEQNIWHEDTDKEFRAKYGDPIATEGESTVFYDEKRGIVIKTKNTLQYHDLLEAIVGVKLHNQIFPQAPLTITGFGNDSEGFVIVIEQPFVVKANDLTQEEIDDYVDKLGDSFEKEDIKGLSGRYQNNGIELHDMHEGNVIRTHEGNIIVIDCVIRPKNLEKWLKDNDFYQSTNISTQLSTTSNEIYGFTSDNNIILNKDKFRLDTPVHEYTHLWDKACMEHSPELWKRGVELMKQTDEWQRVIEDDNYANIKDNEDLVASEVHSRLSGMLAAGKAISFAGNKRIKKGFWAKLIDWFKQFKDFTLRHVFGMSKEDAQKVTLEQFLSAPVVDFMLGTDPRDVNNTNYTIASKPKKQAKPVDTSLKVGDTVQYSGIAKKAVVRSITSKGITIGTEDGRQYKNVAQKHLQFLYGQKPSANAKFENLNDAVSPEEFIARKLVDVKINDTKKDITNLDKKLASKNGKTIDELVLAIKDEMPFSISEDEIKDHIIDIASGRSINDIKQYAIDSHYAAQDAEYQAQMSAIDNAQTTIQGETETFTSDDFYDDVDFEFDDEARNAIDSQIADEEYERSYQEYLEQRANEEGALTNEQWFEVFGEEPQSDPVVEQIKTKAEELKDKVENEVPPTPFNIINDESGLDTLKNLSKKAKSEEAQPLDTFKPAISEWWIDDKSIPAIVGLRKKYPKANFEYIYQLYKSTGAYDYVKEGKLRKDQEVYIGYGQVGKLGNGTPLYNVVFFVKDDKGNYQLIGTLSDTANQDPKTAKELHEQVEKLYNKQDTNGFFTDITITNTKPYVSEVSVRGQNVIVASGEKTFKFSILAPNGNPITTTVSKVLNGSLMWSETQHSLKETTLPDGKTIANAISENENGKHVRIGFFDASTQLHDNMTADEQQIGLLEGFRNVGSKAKGHIVLILNKPDGRYQLVPMHVALFGDLMDNPYNPIVNDVNNILKKAWQIYSDNSMLIDEKDFELTKSGGIIQQLNEKLHFSGGQLHLFFEGKNGGISLSANGKAKVKNADGTLPRPKSEAEFLQLFNYQLADCMININEKNISDQKVLNKLIMSDVFSTNLSGTDFRNAFFTVKPVDAKGKIKEVYRDMPEQYILKNNQFKKIYGEKVATIGDTDVYMCEDLDGDISLYGVKQGTDEYNSDLLKNITTPSQRARMLAYAKIKAGMNPKDEFERKDIPADYIQGIDGKEYLVHSTIYGDEEYYETETFVKQNPDAVGEETQESGQQASKPITTYEPQEHKPFVSEKLIKDALTSSNFAKAFIEFENNADYNQMLLKDTLGNISKEQLEDYIECKKQRLSTNTKKTIANLERQFGIETLKTFAAAKDVYDSNVYSDLYNLLDNVTDADGNIDYSALTQEQIDKVFDRSKIITDDNMFDKNTECEAF